ncbi:hypothetical protein [Nonomuraea pusilla]|uniref:Uncharacterized protein n=1 Tax=Nonomuraea pusilla TaxID=46177 RepID=A0A1H7TAB6_9ACTN|nr:hypothetical protein [Nonomuraea pusilla]SEL81683.1 hypothetical protein SAMN05660976_03410 [Nonomuraea pusilla]
MTSETRRVVGAAAGLAAFPLVYHLTEAGARALRQAYASFGPAWAGALWLAAVAVLVAVLGAWPAAALACGLPLTAAGLLFALDADTALGLADALRPVSARPPWPEAGEPPGAVAGTTGLYVLVGALLLLSAVRRHPRATLRR